MNETETRVLTIDLTLRLPDTHTVPDEYSIYGRVAILNSGSYWFGTEKTSHPHCRVGFYYAVRADRLYLSPRGVAYDWQRYITDDLIRFLSERLHLKNTFKYFRLQSDNL